MFAEATKERQGWGCGERDSSSMILVNFWMPERIESAATVSD